VDGTVEERKQPGDIGRVLAQVERERGLDLSKYRLSYIERRLATRLRSLGFDTYREYSRYLEEHTDEYTHLVDALTINVTEFFRDAPMWRVFRDQVVPALVDAKTNGHQRVIRVWSAGSATGEEAYSIAMSFLSVLGPGAPGYVLSIVGTDLDPRALDVASRGEYDISKLQHIPDKDRERFLDIGRDTFQVRREVRDHVKFRRLDLISGTPPQVIDLIFCRNVFIYFTRDQQSEMVRIFHGSLARGGFLVLGRTEKMPTEATPGFEAISGKERIYRKA
jgi:chemotaxis protein methyltransferase CheR